MADRIEAFDVTVTAGVAKTTPAVSPISFPPGQVVGVEVVIPDGVSGLAGWALAQAHQQVLPRTAGAFITGNDETVKWPLKGYLNTGDWQLITFNTDVFDHTFSVRFLVDENSVGLPGPAPPPALSSIGPEAPAGSVDTGQVPIGDDSGGLPPAPPDDTGPPIGDTGDTGDLPPEPPDTGDQGAPDDTSLPADDALPPLDDIPLGDAPDAGTGTGDAGAFTGGKPKGGGAGKRRPPAHHKPATKGHPVAAPHTITTHTVLPAGGWLPRGARFTLERIDQGQDFITDWRGPIIAPGPGRVVSIGHDRPWPSGFGPAYAVVAITGGRWAGRTLYIGHCTAAVRAGQTFHTGAVLAHADQGQRDGGGWVELGEASALGHGIQNQGAKIAHLFGPVRVTHTAPAPSHPVAHKGAGHGNVPTPHHAKPQAKRAPAKAAAHQAPQAKRAPAPAATHHPAPHIAPPPVKRAPAPPKRVPPAPARRSPPPPPPPSPRRAPAPPAPKRHR